LVKAFLELLDDPIVRGFVLTTILLLGLCLEQSLLNQPFIQNIASSFLVGNLIGYPVAIFLWRIFYQKVNIPLYSWPLEAFLVVFFALKPLPIISLVIGIVFPLLLLHLFLLAHYSVYASDFNAIILRVAFGIGLGNFLLLVFQYVPYPLGIGWLSVALAAWRIRCPSTRAIIKPFSKHQLDKKYLIFLIFLFLFYTVGGLYYELLKGLSSKNLAILDEFNYILYVVGLAASVPLARFQKELIPFIAITIMGGALLFMTPPFNISPYSVSAMELSFGMMDSYSIAYIFSAANGLEEVSLGLGIFPFSILTNMLILNHLPPVFDIRWGLGFLFLTLIPLSLLTRSSSSVRRRRKVSPPFVLPTPTPENNTFEDILEIEKLERESLKRLSSNKGKMGCGHLNCDVDIDADTDAEVEVAIDETDTEAQIHDQNIKMDLESLVQVLNLTSREQEIFALLVKGKKLKEIAKELDIALGTIKALTSRIYEKADVDNREELFKKWMNE